MKHFVKLANHILVQKPHAVLEKIELPPSGDKHDFLTLAPYRWPNPEKNRWITIYSSRWNR
jgi:hypothetical protein